MIKETINKAAEKIIGRKTNNKKKGWYNDKCQKMVNAKIKARLKWLSAIEEKQRVDYKKKRKQCNRVIRKCKRDWMDSEIKQ